MNNRLDNYLLSKKMAHTRSQAQMLIKQGSVSLNGDICFRPGQKVLETDDVIIDEKLYVSRGAYKLRGALEFFNINLKGKSILDVGASTGGFTQLCLEQGANKVIAVDVGQGQLSDLLKNDPRVENLEKTDIRSLNKINTVMDLVVMDVSFISVRLIIPHLRLLTGADILMLFKPQFEVGKKFLGKNGLVDKNISEDAMRAFEQWLNTLRIGFRGPIACDFIGKQGNQEFFYLLTK